MFYTVGYGSVHKLLRVYSGNLIANHQIVISMQFTSSNQIQRFRFEKSPDLHQQGHESVSNSRRPYTQNRRVNYEIHESLSTRQSIVSPNSSKNMEPLLSLANQGKDKNQMQRIRVKKNSDGGGSKETLKFTLNLASPTLPKPKSYFKFEEDTQSRFQPVASLGSYQSLIEASQRLAQDLIKRTGLERQQKSQKIQPKHLSGLQKNTELEKLTQNISLRSHKRSEDMSVLQALKDKQKIHETARSGNQSQYFAQSKQITDNEVEESPQIKQIGHRKNISKLSEFKGYQSTPTTLKEPSNLLENISIPVQLDASRHSSNKNGFVRNYAANTHQGLVRNYNEDRVSIIVNVNNTHKQIGQPQCSYFAVYDGHGGSFCSDYLRDNLHLYIVRDENFQVNPLLAVQRGYERAENLFTQQCMSGLRTCVEKSGSCSVSVLIVGDYCYVANVGDSRAILSLDGGRKVTALTRDHKPNDEREKQRVILAGGKVYQSQGQGISRRGVSQPIMGPHRVFPGRLSVTRSFGDVEAKVESLGGKKGVVIAAPEIISFKISDNHDFIVLASDGIYDKLTNEEVVQCVWETQSQIKNKIKIHEYGALAVENIMKLALHKRTLDNITVVLIGFANLKKKLNLKQMEQKVVNELNKRVPKQEIRQNLTNQS